MMIFILFCGALKSQYIDLSCIMLCYHMINMDFVGKNMYLINFGLNLTL